MTFLSKRRLSFDSISSSSSHGIYSVLNFVRLASIGQVEGTSNVAEINKVILPYSSNIYIISWKGHTYIYNPPFVTEINP